MTEDRSEILNDYLDGTLPQDERAELERRLGADPALAAELRELRALVAAAAELPREATPFRDLWPGIERRLREGPGAERPDAQRRIVPVASARLGWWVGAVAAAAALVIFVVTRPPGGGGGPEIAAGNAAAPDGAPAEIPASPLDRADLEYAAASRDVLDRLQRNEELDPETVELIRRNLDIIDGAVREIREALDASPESARLHHRLSAEYRRRGEVLRQAADLTSSI